MVQNEQLKAKTNNASVSYFNQFTDEQLKMWYIEFHEVATGDESDYEAWKAFHEEVKTRSLELQEEVKFIDSIL